MIAYETRIGKVELSEAYLSKLIGHEVTSCFGVVGMLPSNSKQKIFKVISKKESADTGIRITASGDEIDVELHIVVTYGMNINAIAASITEKVKYVVKEATGITVNRVVVKVDGIKE
ncbi:MAG: Asp23/Gls24 family envelope stress response protein [Clostridia bacterium]|nr:Asp23/Gls24 family envelope stress response protein [Clostridia bacterium]